MRIDFAGGWTDIPIFAREEGGAVLNAAITRYAEGYLSRPEPDSRLHLVRGNRSYVTYRLDVPSGAGLGASAAQTVLWVTLVKTAIANTSNRRDIAEMACQIADLLGIIAGKQDEYASALGGLTYYTFGDTVTEQRLRLPPSVAQDLRLRLTLAYTGRPRHSRVIHQDVWSAYETGDQKVVHALRSLKGLAGQARVAMESGDVDGLAELMNENWAFQKELHSAVSNSELDRIVSDALTHGARGGKACGAGGGGCFLFVAHTGRTAELRVRLRALGLSLIDFDFDTMGVHLRKG